MTQKLKILLVDDHKIVTEGLAALLSTVLECKNIVQVHNAEDALSYLSNHSVDLVFMDVIMPGRLNGIAATQHVKTAYPNTKVIALTMLSDAATIKASTEAGADGFLIKNTSSEHIQRAVASVLDNQFYLHPTLQASLKLSSNLISQPQIELSQIEYDILQHILDGKTTVEIGKSMFRSPETIKTHRKRIMAKLKCKNIAELVRFAIENKLLA